MKRSPRAPRGRTSVGLAARAVLWSSAPTMGRLRRDGALEACPCCLSKANARGLSSPVVPPAAPCPDLRTETVHGCVSVRVRVL